MAHQIKCAHCKRNHETVQQVKDCAARHARPKRDDPVHVSAAINEVLARLGEADIERRIHALEEAREYGDYEGLSKAERRLL